VIDFRYHLVSIIAVFLALAVGLLVGSTYLSGYQEEALAKLEHTVNQENNTLRAKNSLLKQQVAADQTFAQASAGRLLPDLLQGQKVVLVVAPNADSGTEAGVASALQAAGASVTGTLTLQSSFFDSSGQTEGSLTQLAQQYAPQAGVKLPAGGSGQQEAGAVLAAGIVSKDGIGLADAESHAVLSAFASGGFLTTNLTSPAATLAVLLTPDTGQATTGQAKSMNNALVVLAAQLRAASLGTVMAGSLAAIGPGSAISQEGGSGPASTVDYADYEAGQIMVVQALRLLLNGKAPQAFGIGPNAAPSPAPTPVPTSTASLPITKGTTK
jgi:hypothetical protein